MARGRQVGGVRGMERGTLSEQRDADGKEPLANMELVRLAMPRRVYTLSQVPHFCAFSCITKTLEIWHHFASVLRCTLYLFLLS